MSSVQAIDALLPQTQCRECGYAGCQPYAQALAQRQAPIDRCPPGGLATLTALANLLHVDPKPYHEAVAQKTRQPSQAVIREAECIGCTKCIQACPVDAIIGSSKHMHTVLHDECTGCGLCVEPCPVDCIEMHTLPEPQFDKHTARVRFQARHSRLEQEAQQKQRFYQEKRKLAAPSPHAAAPFAKQDYIQQLMAQRAGAKKPNE